MPTTIINPHKMKKFPYSTTPHKRRLGIKIEANNPITAYIVQKSDLEAWRDGDDWEGFNFKSTKLVDAQVNIPKGFDEDWYLILVNGRDSPAAVYYELFDL